MHLAESVSLRGGGIARGYKKFVKVTLLLEGEYPLGKSFFLSRVCQV